jgi:tetratricopeptide (TPR) repeat protein
MAESDSVAQFRDGFKLLKAGYAEKALPCFRQAFESEKHNPFYISFFGLTLARAERKWDRACELCEVAIQLRGSEIQFHLNLAEVYVCAGRRGKAIDTLDAAMQIFGNDVRLKRARSRVEKRRAPVLTFLSRNNFLNRNLGKIRHRTLKHLGKENL